MKLPYLLALSTAVVPLLLIGCGGGGTDGPQDWRTQLFVNDLENYEYVITRNNNYPGDSSDECNSLYGDNPTWCQFFNDGSVDFTVNLSNRPYNIFVRRVDRTSPTVSAAVGKQNNDAFERRNGIRLDGSNYIYLWEVNLNSTRYYGTSVTGRAVVDHAGQTATSKWTKAR